MTRVRKVLFISLLFVGLSGQALGAEQSPQTISEVVRIWPGEAPGTSDWKITETSMPFKDKNGNPAWLVTDISDPTLTIVRPAAGRRMGLQSLSVPAADFRSWHGI